MELKGFSKTERANIFGGILDTLSLQVPILDITTILTSYGFKQLPWQYKVTMGPHKGIPLILFLNRKGESKFAIGILEQDKEIQMQIRLDEIVAAYNLEISIGAKASVHIFKDETTRPWPQVVKDYRDAVGIKPSSIPKEAYEPVFCTWYGIHHKVNQHWCLENAKIAKKLGLTTFIIDDGWFFDEEGEWGDYARTGDWELSRSKFPDLRGFVTELHEMDMRVLLWISPFMVGRQSKAYKTFEKHLIGEEKRSVRYLEPSSQEVRDYIISKMASLYKDYELDGFKIDFIDSLPKSDGLIDFYREIKNIGSNPIFEFRQYYANMFGLPYGTIYRAVDAPLDFETNLERCILLRVFTPDVPIHIDYLYWHKDEKLENIAKAMIASIFFVPTVSVDLMELSEERKKVIKRWLDFHKECKDVLLFGDFVAYNSNIQVRKNKKAIFGLFKENLIEIEEDLTEVYILNATESENIWIKRGNEIKSVKIPIGEALSLG